jgi:hypothetical protein
MNYERMKVLVESANSAASTDWEKAFAKDQADRLKKWRETTIITEKQTLCLRKIVTNNWLRQDPEFQIPFGDRDDLPSADVVFSAPYLKSAVELGLITAQLAAMLV